MTAFQKLIPELTVSDIEATKRFYMDALGFALEYERKADRFAFLSLGDVQFMFEEYHPDGWNTGKLEYPYGRGVNFSCTVPDVSGLYQRAVRAGVAPYRELTTNRYRVAKEEIEQTEFLVQDPDGYLIRFTD